MNQKKYYIFICFYIIKNNMNWNIPLFPQEHLIIQSNCNINSMYENIINNIESKLSNESKNILYNNYYKIINNNIEKEPIKKIKNTNLDSNINKVLFTSHPDFKCLTEKDNEKELNIENNLISKNMTERDIQKEKLDKQQKKLDLFSNLISYKKTKKNILDYYNDPNNIEINNNNCKNIIFSKRN